jgi:hypothetical protein
VRLTAPVGIRTVRHDGWAHLVSDLPTRVPLMLNGANQRDKVIAVIALLDLYGPTFYPAEQKSAADRYAWARRHFEGLVNDSRFRLFFAVHEIEAWLLSDPALFPAEVRKGLPPKATRPEDVNFNEPPAKLLERLYERATKSKLARDRTYKKVADGAAMFAKLNPQTAYEKCPYLKLMLDDMLALAQEAGL